MIDLPEAAAAARISSAVDAGDGEAVAVLLRADGDAVLAAGRARLVAAAVRALPPAARSGHDRALLGLALVVLGDGPGAESALRGDGTQPLPTSHAWRLAMLRHLAGDPSAALDVLAAADASGADLSDQAQAANWSAAAAWLRGDEAACARHASAAEEVATRTGSDVDWAAAHSALALRAMLAGDRRANAWHWHRALDAARRAGDVLQEVRIRTNLGSHLLEECRYAAAAAEIARAAALAHRVGFAVLDGLNSCNLGECQLNLGRLDESVASFDRARSIWQQTGSRMVAYALTGLGDAYRERGDLVLARAAYDEAVVASESTYSQAYVPALSGLARVLAADDHDDARRVAEQAAAAACRIEAPRACLTLAWLRLAAGDRECAVAAARDIARDAMCRRDRIVLGEALELQAMCAGDSTIRSHFLIDAGSVWHEIEYAPGLRRVAYALSRLCPAVDVAELPALGALLSSPDSGTRQIGQCRPRAAGLRAAVDAVAGERIEVRVLGRFEVLRGGHPVDEREWQSRKARELVRVLVARRGRPIAREALAELLWPDDEPDQLGNRLSVALAVVRRVFDPSREHGPGHHVRAEDGVVALNLDHVHVDVEDFLRECAAALSRQVDPDDARRRLRRVVENARGEALGEDLYADWAVGLRDEVQAMVCAALRALTGYLAAEPADGLPYLVRLLDADPYDESAHQQLISSLVALGRFGAARRAHHRYALRMRELGLPTAPFPLPAARARWRAAATPA